jgi:UDP-glucose 4-epimerase
MNILITGGAGYIGSELLKSLVLLPEVEHITVYDNLSRENYQVFFSETQKLNHSKVTFEFGDLLDSRKLRKVLKGIDVVYHAAAQVSTPFSQIDGHTFEQVNHWGTAELIYAIEETPTVKKVFYLSSCSVYGFGKNVVDESSPLNPRTVYGVSKMRGEEHVTRLSNKIQSYVLRIANVYGYSPSMRFDAVINKFMFEAHYKNRISVHGNGKQHRSFIHINKVVGALTDMLKANIPSGVYNLTDKNIEINDLVDQMKYLYPDLEFIFINQHLELREQVVNLDLNLKNYISIKESTIEEELKIFKTYFSFQ